MIYIMHYNGKFFDFKAWITLYAKNSSNEAFMLRYFGLRIGIKNESGAIKCNFHFSS